MIGRDFNNWRVLELVDRDSYGKMMYKCKCKL